MDETDQQLIPGAQPRLALRNARIDRGLTQKQLGKLCRMSQQRIAKFENGMTMNDEAIVAIAQALGVSTDDILGLKERPRVPVVGKLSVNGLVIHRTVLEGQIFADPPPGIDPTGVVALDLAGEIWPMYRAGDRLFLSPPEPPGENIHEECVVTLEGGELHLRRILPGREPGRFDLQALTSSAIMENQVVLECRRVLSVVKARRTQH